MRSIAAIVIAVSLCATASAQPEPARDLDPIVLTGNQLPNLLTAEVGRIVAFRYSAAGWVQIPVQVDERKLDNLCRIRRVNGNVEAIVYADPTLITGPDDDASFDGNDELVFMWRDMGPPASEFAPPGVIVSTRTEIHAPADDLFSDRYAYLFVTEGGHDPAAGENYVEYDFQLFGDPFGPGPNPENSTMTSALASHHFSDRWIHDEIRITAGNAPGADIIDRVKFQFAPGNCNRTTDTFSLGNGAFIANIDGPVRAVRSVIGANSGTLTQRDWLCCEGRLDTNTYVRVHAIGGTWFFHDFDLNAFGMIYYDNLNLDGFPIDGTADPAETGLIDWQFATGGPGALTIAHLVETDIEGTNRFSHYFDDFDPDWNQCTGDPWAFAASGPATGGLPNTDPLRGKAFSLSNTAVYFVDRPWLSVDDALTRVAAAQEPIEIIVRSD